MTDREAEMGALVATLEDAGPVEECANEAGKNETCHVAPRGT